MSEESQDQPADPESGTVPATPGSTVRNLDELDDLAASYSPDVPQEVRFPGGELELSQCGMSHHRLKPDRRQAFGHRHQRAEEVYVVLAGSGRVKLDDEIREVGRLDAIRVGPEVVRAFEAGPEGLEFIAFGRRFEGDGQVVRDWWVD